MATFVATTVNNISGSAGSTHTATRTITAGDLVVFCVKWEDAQTLSSVSDSAGGTWAIATQQAHGSAPQPIGAIAYCLSHPGGTNVVITANFSGSASPILEADVMCFRPAGGTTFAFDAAATPGVGTGATFTAGSSISTAAAGVVAQFLAGFQNCTGVVAGGTPTFTRDTDTENASGTTFAQYLLSGSAQTVTPGCSWGAFGAKYVLLAAAFKEVAGGSAPTVTNHPAGSAASVGSTTQFSVTSPDATSYQWQTSTDRGNSWSSVSGGSGGTTATYTTPSTVLPDNGRMYRCVLTNANGSTNSLGAFFHVKDIATPGMGAHPSGLFEGEGWAPRGDKTPIHSPGAWIGLRALTGGRNADFATAARTRYFPAAPPTPLAPWPGRRQAEVRSGFGAPLSVRRMRGVPPALLLPAPVAQSLSFSLSTAVQVAQSVTTSLGLAVQAPQSASTSVSLAVQQALSAQASVDAALQLARTAAASLDTAVQLARSATVGADMAVQAGRTATASADLAVQQGRSATTSVDAYVQASTQLAVAIDLLVQQGNSLSVAVQIAVQAARTASSNVDLAVQLARQASASVDTAVQAARSAAAQVDVAVQAARSAGVSVDLFVQAGFAVSTAVDTAVRFSATAATAVGAAIQLTRTAVADVSVVVSVQRVVSAALQAVVQAAASAAAQVSLYVFDPAAFDFTADSRARVGAAQASVSPGRVGEAKATVPARRIGRRVL